MLRSLSVATVIVISTSFSFGSSATASPASTTTSPSSGTTSSSSTVSGLVSTAIDTAFPVIGKILDLFGADPKKTTATKQEVTKAATDVQKQLDTVKQKIQPVATVAKELKITEAFATAAVNAEPSVVTIQTLLKAPAPDYDQIDTEWKVAKNDLADILTTQPKDLQAVSDEEIRLRLMKLQDARKDLMVRIDKNIANAVENKEISDPKQKKSMSKRDLQQQVDAMRDLMKGLNAIAAMELQSMQTDIEDLAKWASATQGGSPQPVTFNKGLLDTVDKSLGSAQAALSRKSTLH